MPAESDGCYKFFTRPPISRAPGFFPHLWVVRFPKSAPFPTNIPVTKKRYMYWVNAHPADKIPLRPFMAFPFFLIIPHLPSSAHKHRNLPRTPTASGRRENSPILHSFSHVGRSRHLFLILLHRPSVGRANRIRQRLKRARLGKNHRPTAYKTGALTAELVA